MKYIHKYSFWGHSLLNTNSCKYLSKWWRAVPCCILLPTFTNSVCWVWAPDGSSMRKLYLWFAVTYSISSGLQLCMVVALPAVQIDDGTRLCDYWSDRRTVWDLTTNTSFFLWIVHRMSTVAVTLYLRSFIHYESVSTYLLPGSLMAQTRPVCYSFFARVKLPATERNWS